jgi:hypothetical protein
MLTYILGAGASYQSIPIVNTFPKRFKEFVRSLIAFGNKYGNTREHIEKFLKAAEIGRTLATSFEEHQSFDTYFKKLFHTNELLLIKKYKKLLNLYFIWEHVEEAKPLLDENGDIVEADDIFHKQSKVDKRYDALIAGLLQPIAGENKMFCKTNFITWNYDLNLISSIKNYFFPDATYKEFLEEIGFRNAVWNIQDQISIINMNGFFYSDVFNDVKDIYSLDAFELLKTRMVDSYFDDDYIADDAEFIKFAWENNNDGKILGPLFELLKDSENVVVIGYTFPLYNRLVDSAFLQDRFLASKKLTIQDPNAENILNDFSTYFFGASHATSMKTVTNCTHFFVPNKIVK